MTLAAILVFSIIGTLSEVTLAGQTPTAPAAETAPSQPQDSPPAQNPSTTSPPPTSAAPGAAVPVQSPSDKTTPRKKPRHKKRVLPPNCGSATTSTADPATGESPAKPATSGAPKNCPPSKVIVQQGGTADSSIQLGGSASGTTSHQRDTANQMLAATEANLKKIAGQQLSSNQKEMVTQIRQFMEQSKAAVGDGDPDRARTLAWKAQLLSEELVKPDN